MAIQRQCTALSSERVGAVSCFGNRNCRAADDGPVCLSTGGPRLFFLRRLAVLDVSGRASLRFRKSLGPSMKIVAPLAKPRFERRDQRHAPTRPVRYLHVAELPRAVFTKPDYPSCVSDKSGAHFIGK